MLESYFRNGHRINHEWLYEGRPCFLEFREEFPDAVAVEATFVNALRYVVKLFRDTGSVGRKSGSGRPTKRTLETVDNVRKLLRRTWGCFQTFSFVTVHKFPKHKNMDAEKIGVCVAVSRRRLYGFFQHDRATAP